MSLTAVKMRDVGLLATTLFVQMGCAVVEIPLNAVNILVATKRDFQEIYRELHTNPNKVCTVGWLVGCTNK